MAGLRPAQGNVPGLNPMAVRAQQSKNRAAPAGGKGAASAKPRKGGAAPKKASKKRGSAASATTVKKTAARKNGRPDEVAQLQAELATARARILELEAMHEDAVNRIDWVIDSLQTLLADQSKD